MKKYDHITSLVTLICSYLSLLGSLLVILSYLVARTKSTPNVAYLIVHLAVSDLFWFSAASLESTYWFTHDGSVPTNICYVCSPAVIYFRMASLLWTCVISFNVYLSMNSTKRTRSQESSWNTYRYRYYALVVGMALPATILNIIKQHTLADDNNLGCDAGYEPLGTWYLVLFTEALPILIGFSFNVYVFYILRDKISLTAYPHSVRKRRKRLMYNYILINVVCWSPTIIFYSLEIAGYVGFITLHSPQLKISII